MRARAAAPSADDTTGGNVATSERAGQQSYDAHDAEPLINREFLAAIDVHLSRFFERLGFDDWLDDYLADRELRVGADGSGAGASRAHRLRLFGCYLTYYGIPRPHEARQALGGARGSWTLQAFLSVHQTLPLISTDGLLHIARVMERSA